MQDISDQKVAEIVSIVRKKLSMQFKDVAVAIIEDAVSNSVEKYLRKKDSLSFASIGSLYNWLVKVARNEILKEVIRKSRFRVIDDAHAELSDQVPGEIFEIDDFWNYVRGLVTKKNRVVIDMIIEGVSISDIAVALGITYDTAKHRADRTMRGLGFIF